MSVSEHTGVEQDLAEVRAELAEVRAELERMRADLPGARRDATQTREMSRSLPPRLGRVRAKTAGKSEHTPGLMSRRRMFGLLGGAAAAGAGLAVAGSALTADPAGATAVTTGTADGDALQIGGLNTNSASTTFLSGSSGNGNAMFEVDQSSGGGLASALKGKLEGGTGGIGVWGDAIGATSGIGVYGSSPDNAALVLEDDGVTMPPTTGPWQTGSFVVSQGRLWFCTDGGIGSAAGFVQMSPLVQIPPARIYDSRVGQLPSTGPKTPITTGTTVNLDVTNNSSGVPATASAVLGNVTVTNSGNGFLTVFASGATQPATSNINLTAGLTLANNFTSKVGTSHEIAVTCGGPGPTDFVVDVFGYYP